MSEPSSTSKSQAPNHKESRTNELAEGETTSVLLRFPPDTSERFTSTSLSCRRRGAIPTDNRPFNRGRQPRIGPVAREIEALHFGSRRGARRLTRRQRE